MTHAGPPDSFSMHLVTKGIDHVIPELELFSLILTSGKRRIVGEFQSPVATNLTSDDACV